jgi:uncharacterized membrane protein
MWDLFSPATCGRRIALLSENGAEMTTDSNEADFQHTPPSSDARDSIRRFPWRVFPVALLCLYGGLVIACSLITAFAIVCGEMIFIGRGQIASDAQLYVILFGMIATSAHGCAAIVATRNIWKLRWKRSATAIMIAIVLAAVIYMLAAIVDQLPGRPVPLPSNKVVERE